MAAFKDVGSSNVAFGANLLGAMVGGVLEYLSLVTGYRMLLIIVAVLYGSAFAFERGIRVAGRSAASPEAVSAAADTRA